MLNTDVAKVRWKNKIGLDIRKCVYKWRKFESFIRKLGFVNRFRSIAKWKCVVTVWSQNIGKEGCVAPQKCGDEVYVG